MARSTLWFCVLVGALLLSACGSRRASRAVRPATVGMAQPGAACGGTLAVSVVRARAGCQIDDRVSGQQAGLEYACGGGPARAAFGASVFEGSLNGDELDISIETAFDFTDGCRWRTKQRISGPLSRGAFLYEYEESPEEGQSGCAAACRAEGSVQLLQ